MKAKLEGLDSAEAAASLAIECALSMHEYWEPVRRALVPAGAGESGPVPFRHALPKVGRNAPCPCGSGKKYKRCCGTN